MRILFFSSYYYPYISGITTYPRMLFSSLIKEYYHSVTVLTFPHQKELFKTQTDNQVKIIRVPYTLRISKGYLSLPSIYHFFIHTQNADLVILNSPNFEALFLAVYARLFRKPIITIFHCHVVLQKGVFSRVIEFFLEISVFIQLLFSKYIIIYTKDYYDSLGFEKIFTSKTKEILPPVTSHNVDKIFLKKLIKMKGKQNWIGYSGRIASEKGLSILIQSVALLDSPDNYKLVFAGPYGEQVAGEKEYYINLLKLLKKFQIKHEFLGCLDGGKLGAFYKAIDILVLPSINKTEAFGMVQVESMLLGTPVIASNLPGVRVPIQLTGMGRLVIPGNIESLTEAIYELLQNQSKYSNTQLNSRAKAIFSAKKSIESINQLICKI